ncbi:MAG: hypothetical protein WBB85_20815 [Albidovulum sp.]|uniref:hypothetical protein n=1 Tax=Albidovulum sp. TaxID=1872424 RepID=UPI003CAD702C
MTEQQIMQREIARVRDLLSEAIGEIEADGGNLRFFAASLITAAIQLHAEVEGSAGLERAIAKLAALELVRTGEAGRC